MVTAKVIAEEAAQSPGHGAPHPRPHSPAQVVDPRATSWADLYPFESNFVNVGDEHDPRWLHYVDEGPRDAPVVVMCHGNPTWSFMYRDVINALKDEFRCIVPDHMGCGLSDRPQGWSYQLADHADNLGKLVDHVGAKDVTLIMHDWGGMIGCTWAVEHAEQIRSMVVLNTASFLGKLPLRIKTVRIPVFGRAAVLGFNAFVRTALVSCTHHKEVLTDAIKAGYLAPYGNAHDRLATLRFVEDVPQQAGHPTWDLVEQTDGKLGRLADRPLLVCWGERDWCFTPAFREGWQQRFPDAEVHAYDDAAHFILEDATERVIGNIRPFVEKTRAPRSHPGAA